MYKNIRYDMPRSHVARITLSRVEVGNAQDFPLLYEIDRALSAAGADNDVKAVIICGDGIDFSVGHDIAGSFEVREEDRVTQGGGFDLPGVEGFLATEEDAFVGLCWRWRNFPKPLIAQVQGRVISGGLMLIWPCDLIIAGTGTTFWDPVGACGMNGHEYFVHPWELGARKAKEMLFTSEAVTAEDGYRLGMVNHIVPEDELEEFTLALAEKISSRPTLGLKLAKKCVNQTLDVQGQFAAVQGAFGWHQLGHAHNRIRFGELLDSSGLSSVPAPVQDAWKHWIEDPNPDVPGARDHDIGE